MGRENKNKNKKAKNRDKRGQMAMTRQISNLFLRASHQAGTTFKTSLDIYVTE